MVLRRDVESVQNRIHRTSVSNHQRSSRTCEVAEMNPVPIQLSAGSQQVYYMTSLAPTQLSAGFR